MNQPGQWGIQGAQMVATLAKGVDFQRGKTGLLNEFQDENSKKSGLRHLHSVAENGVRRLVGLVNLLRGSFHYSVP